MRPRITLKLATSLDGKIALANGQSQWVTGDGARAHGRYLRAENDAIAVGANTAVLDDPLLTARSTGARDPKRVVFDTTLRIDPTSQLIQTAKDVPTIIFTQDASTQSAKALEYMGAQVFQVSTDEGLSLNEAMSHLWNIGVKSLLVEGGGMLIASFIRAGLFDTLHWYRAPILMGGDSRDCVGALALTNMHQAIRLTRMKVGTVGQDLHEIYERKD